MAKLTKRQKKALNARTKDGKITINEQKKLEALGISRDRIQQAADNRKAPITNSIGNEVRIQSRPGEKGANLAKGPSQAAAPQAEDKIPDPPGNTKSGENVKANQQPEKVGPLKKAGADGKISQKEARKLAELGIGFEKIQDKGWEIGPAGKQLLKGNDDQGIGPKAQANARLVLEHMLAGGRPSGLSKEERDRQRFVETRKLENRDDSYQPLSPSAIAQIDDREKAWEKVLEKVGIKNYNSENDVAKVWAYVNSAAGGGTWGNGGNGSAPSGTPRDTGEYKDILNALEEDRIAGNKQAQQIRNLKAQLAEVDPEVQKQLDELSLANTGLQNELKTQADTWQGKLDDANKASAATIAQLQTMLINQTNSANNLQTTLQSQLATTQAALTAQQKLTKNLSNAYVPAAEQSALSVAYGDSRNSPRKRTTNSLSDLSIVTGTGTSSSLSGLQIAG